MKIWDASLNAFRDAKLVRRYDTELNAFIDVQGAYISEAGVRRQVWPDRLYLYKLGDECITVTGGWTPEAIGSNINKKENMLEITFDMGVAYKTAQLCCKNPVNFGEYRTAHMIVSSSVKNYTVISSSNLNVACRFGIYKTYQTTWNDPEVYATITGPILQGNTESIDIEYVTNLPDVVMYPAIRSATGTVSVTAKFQIKQIWLEK